MCIHKPFAQGAHPLFQYFPGIMDARCTKSYGFIIQDQSNRALCGNCYNNLGCPLEYNLGGWHGLLDGIEAELKCYNCGSNLILQRSIQLCDRCWSAYTNIILKIREDGYPPEAIALIKYDHETKRLSVKVYTSYEVDGMEEELNTTLLDDV